MQNRKYDTRQMLEMGLMAGLIIIFTFIVNYVPIFDLLASIILPIPIVILYVRHDVKIAIAASVVSFLLMVMLINPLSALISIIVITFSGFTLGYCIKNKKGFVKTLIYQTIASIAGTILKTYLYIALILKVNLYKYIETMFIEPFKESLNISKSLYEGMGIDVSSNPIFSVIDSMDVRFILLMIPSVLILTGLISSYVNFIVSKSVLNKLGYKTEETKPFTHWYFDNRVAALFIIIICLGVILKSLNMPIGDYIYTSSTIVFQCTILLSGLSVISYYLKYKFNIKKGLMIFIIIFAFVFQPLYIFATLLGIMDILLDLRRLDPNSLYNSLKKKFKK